VLPKDINCVYTQKRLLSEMLQLLDPSVTINVTGARGLSYTGSGIKLNKLGVDFAGLEKGIKSYE
jgi:hypothetical protein